MPNEDKNQQVKVPESTMRYVEQARKDAEEAYQRIGRAVSGISLQLPKIPEGLAQILKEAGELSRRMVEDTKVSDEGIALSVLNPDVIRERNVWERHKEVLDTQNALMGIQGQLLEEQKSGSKMAKWILVLTALLVVLTIGLLVLTIILVLRDLNWL